MHKLFFLLFLSTIPGLPVNAQQEGMKIFPLSDVRLLNSPFRRAQETDKKYMLSLDPDRLLAPFLREAGLIPKAENYPNWESTGLDGHIGGHYLSALANMYAATGDKQVKARLEYMISELEKCQQQNPDGYVGGTPAGKKMWNEIAAGEIKAASFSLNDKWVPLYNIHKLFTGLVDAWNIAGNLKAKTILVKLSAWFYSMTTKLSDDQLQTILRSEHGGLNETFADVAVITGDEKYLILAKRLSHRNILDPLLQRRDVLNGLHANTQIPKVIGFARIASLNHDTAWINAADFFWRTVTTRRSISIGGNSVREHFHPSNDFSSMIDTKEGPETCNSYNMLKLSRQLFLAYPSAAYVDYYERTMYNHILSSQHPNGGFVYFTPIRPRHYRVYSQPETSFWCCVGTGMENHGKYGELIYTHNKNDLYVNFFVPSVLNWKEKKIAIEQQTDFPYSERTTLTLALPSPRQFSIFFRYPSWVEDGKLKAWVNNKSVLLKKNREGYVSINRQWNTGDRLSLLLPMRTTAEFLPDSSSWMSFVRGPIVLAAATDTTGLFGSKADESRMGHIANGPLYPIAEAPMIVAGNRQEATLLTGVKNKPFTYSAADLIYPTKYKKLQLVPFFSVHDSRYMIYWRFSTKAQMATIEAALRENEKVMLALEAVTVDQVAPGEQQPESDHQFKGEKTESGSHQDRHWRTSKSWFSYVFTNAELKGSKLRVTYFGKDKDRDFDIYVNSILLANVRLDGTTGERFFDVDYALPPELTKDKSLTVKFVARQNSTAGGIYYLRLLQ